MKKTIIRLGILILLVGLSFARGLAQPTITSFSPASGPVGTEVVITGTNFSTTPSGNVVFFGAVRATVTTSTATTVTVTVPAGATYEPITVLTSGLLAYSRRPFHITFLSGDAVIKSTSFAAKEDFTSAKNPQGVVLGDVDGDGMSDLAVAHSWGAPYPASGLCNTGVGQGDIGFASKIDFTSGSAPNAVAIGDVDGDGKGDMVVSNAVSFNMSVFRNTSTGSGSVSYATKVDFATGNTPYSVSIADLDGDGKADVVVANHNDNTLSVFRNTSTGPGSVSFDAKVDFATGSVPFYVAIGDLDDDGKADLAAANWSSNTVSILRNTSTGPGSIAFTAGASLTTDANPSYVSVGDLDNDGKSDLIASNYGAGTVSVFRNTSAGVGAITFDGRIDVTAGVTPYTVAVGDLNGDGGLDLVIPNSDADAVSILRNTSSGAGSISFAGKVDLATGVKPVSVAIGDVDNDGKPDLAIANQQGNTISVLRNLIQSPPAITSLTPASGAVGTTVTITGVNFDPIPSNNIVHFGATRAAVNSGTMTSLEVTVPAGATYQPVTVSVNGSTAYSRAPFLVTFPDVGQITAASFSAQPTFPYMGTSMAVGDLDSDGKPDLVVSSSETTVTIYRNITPLQASQFTFAAGVDLTVGSSSQRDITIADLNGDGRPELVVTNRFFSTVSVFRNEVTTGIGASAFVPLSDLNVSDAQQVQIADLDLDGHPDLVVSSFPDNLLSVFRNDGSPDIGFETSVTVATGLNPTTVVVADLDGDGKPDLASPGYNASTVSVIRNISSPGALVFQAKVDFTCSTANPSYAQSIVAGDLDGDNKPELVVSNEADNTISILRNATTTGITAVSFEAFVALDASSAPQRVRIGDLDGNGRGDLVVGVGSDYALRVYRNGASSGTLAQVFPTKVDIKNVFGDFEIVDLNLDGKPDIAVTDGTLLLNVSPEIPRIESVEPLRGDAGSLVTITGEYFSTMAEDNIVYFGASRATVTNATDNTLTVEVPTGATYEPISVTVNGLTAYSALPFVVTYPDAYEISPSMFLSSNVSQGQGMTTGDLDADGRPDLVVQLDDNNVSVLRNTTEPGATEASFAPGIHYDVGTSNQKNIAIGDLNGDGRLDIAVSNRSLNTIIILRNNGSGAGISQDTFSQLSVPAVTDGQEIQIRDVDMDGNNDLVVAIFGNNALNVYRNTGFGDMTFEAAKSFGINSNPVSVAIADLDGDGLPDMVAPGYNDNTVSVLRNISTPGKVSFEPRVNFLCSSVTPSYAQYVVVGDLDGDGKPELVVSNEKDGAVAILKNVSTGGIDGNSFEGFVSLGVMQDPARVRIGDIDGNGKPDILVSSYEPEFLVFGNVTTSGISTDGFERVDFDFQYSRDFEVFDMNSDGRPDIAGGSGVFLINNVHAPPTITAFDPASGPIGASVTITGSHFDATPGNNVVYFGATRAVVTGGTSSSLTVDVPGGATYQPITVTSHGLTGYSTHPFIVTFLQSGETGLIDESALSTKVGFAAADQPFRLVIGDFNDDGKSEIVATNNASNSVTVFNNSSTAGSITSASLEGRVDIATVGISHYAAISDLDGDGRPDLVVTHDNTSSVSVFQNTGTSGAITSASFGSNVEIAVNGGGWGLAIGDLDIDGKPDLVVTHTSTISVLRNVSTSGPITSASFAPAVDFQVGVNVQDVVIGDLDGDGKPEIVTINQDDNTISILHNTTVTGSITTESFASKVDFSTGTAPWDVAIGDLDADGKPDIVVANANSFNVSVIKNTSTPGSISTDSFTPKIELDAQPFGTPTGVAIDDINGDGKPDLAVSHADGTDDGHVSVFRNASVAGALSPESFAPPVEFPLGMPGFAVAASDLDGDGKSDVVVANTNADKISVLRNAIVPTIVPIISSFDPVAGAIGSTVTLMGANFDATPENNVVQFNGTVAQVSASSGTSITTTVPAGASTGPISVSTGGPTGTSVEVFTVVPTPSITSFNPTSGPEGTSVTLTGTNFDVAPANNVVKFNGVSATVISSTATTITTSVPIGATTGKITVTVNGETATSANDFTLSSATAPIITDFDPGSGHQGTVVTITGSNFDPQPVNNSVKFNGVSSVVSASTASTITTLVPAGATTGPITVTVNGETATSAANFEVIADTTPPVVTDLSPTTINIGQTLTLTVELNDEESPITSASIEYRSISNDTGTSTLPFNLASGSPYTFNFTGAQVASLGIEYKISATSSGGTFQSPEFIRVTPVYADGLAVPYTSFGSEQSNYRIVAVPLELAANRVGDVFSRLGAYDKTRWRMYRYQAGQTSELTLQTQMVPGSGYWLIVRDDPQGQFITSSGTAVEASFDVPFETDLAAGWNQIGNPYNFNLSWADVQAANPGLPGLRIYNGDFVDSPLLKKMEGGFVKVAAAQKLRFPVIRNIAFQSGRVREDGARAGNPIEGNNWQVYFTLEQGMMRNTISGFGMNKKASEGFDPLDGFNMPKFFENVLELRHDKKEGSDSYSSDIIPPSSEHIWEFVVQSTAREDAIRLSWDNSYFGDGGPELYLWDEALQRAIDMRGENSYTFQKDVSSRFRVIYGSADFIKENTTVRQLAVHDAWPNPASGTVTVSFSLPESASGRVVDISITDPLGKEALAYRGKFTPGYHEVSLERRRDMASGIYFLKIADGATTRLQRIIFK